MHKILNDGMISMFFEMLDPDPSRGYEKPREVLKNKDRKTSPHVGLEPALSTWVSAVEA